MVVINLFYFFINMSKYTQVQLHEPPSLRSPAKALELQWFFFLTLNRKNVFKV